MIQYTIEELHQKLLNNEIDIDAYYQELWDEVSFQQDRLNAFVTITKDKAMESLKYIDVNKGKLQGIPVVLKDNYNTKGILTTASSKMLDDYVPIYDATVVKKLYDAGVCLIGKSSMDELAMGNTNKTALSGPVRNPWDKKRIPGGSSGGSAALVGSGVVPFALGTDTGDSIRKPAGYCGVVGFKPTWGRISRFGVIPYASSLDHVGAFTRSVADMAIVMETLAGNDNKDMTSSFHEVPHYYDNLDTDIKGLKVAVLKTVMDQMKDENIKKNFFSIIELLKNLGAKVGEVEIPHHLMKALLPVYTIISNAEATSNHACLDGIKYGNRKEGETIDGMIIRSRTDGFTSHIKSRFILGNIVLATKNQERMFKKAKRVRRLIVEALNKIYQEYDIILTPNCGGIAPLLDEDNNQKTNAYLALENHLLLGNFAGTPSLSLPSGFVDHMPIAVNIMGRLFEEQTVLNVALALEDVMGFKNQYSREN